MKIKKKAKEFIDYSRKVDNVYENLEDYKQAKKRRVLIVFNDMIEDMESNKELGPVVTELFLREKKIKFSLVFKLKSYFKMSKTKTKWEILFYHENP